MHRFLIVIEQADGNFSAYSPDLPACVATGATREETERRMYEAIQLHVEGLVVDNLPVPISTSLAEYVVVPAQTTSARVFYMCQPEHRIVLLDGMVKKRGHIPAPVLRRLRTLQATVVAAGQKGRRWRSRGPL